MSSGRRLAHHNKHMGSSIESFLDQDGILASSTEKAIKTVVAWQFTQEMKRQGLTKSATAKALNTSRTQLDRILDPQYESVTIATLREMADLLGMRLVVELQPR